MASISVISPDECKFYIQKFYFTMGFAVKFQGAWVFLFLSFKYFYETSSTSVIYDKDPFVQLTG